jgi:hypothetical protein
VEGGVKKKGSEIVADDYNVLLKDVSTLLEAGRKGAARSVNTIMAVTYWHVGKRIVEHEQGGRKRAEYGKAVLKQLSIDLVSRFGRGFSERNLLLMRAFYQEWSIPQTLSAELTRAKSIHALSDVDARKDKFVAVTEAWVRQSVNEKVCLRSGE